MRLKLFKDDRETEFKWALGTFIALAILILFVFFAAVFFKNQSFEKACEAVQDNNAKIVTYLEETEERSLDRVEVELKEGKVPIASAREIRRSYAPLIKTLQPVDC